MFYREMFFLAKRGNKAHLCYSVFIWLREKVTLQEDLYISQPSS